MKFEPFDNLKKYKMKDNPNKFIEYDEYDVILTTFTVNLTKMRYNKICQIPIDNWQIFKSKTVVIPLTLSSQCLMLV